MEQCPQWWRRPLPTRNGFIHFEEDLRHKALLNRSVSCPYEFWVALLLEQERSPAVASAAVPQAAPRESATSRGDSRTTLPSRPVPRTAPENQASAWGSRAGREVLAASTVGAGARVLHATSKKAAAKPAARAPVEVPEQRLELPERRIERTTSSDDDGGEWQIARSSRSAWGRNAQRNREAALLSKPDAFEVAKDQSKWPSGQKGSPWNWASVEEEDARTDATGSTGPGGEEVTSGGSTASREQTRNGEQERDGEVDDSCNSLDDGWTQVPARKKEKKERTLADPAPVVPKPKSDTWATRQECSTPKERSNDVAVVKEAKGSSTSGDAPKGDVVATEQEAALDQATTLGQPSMPSRSGSHHERRYAGGRSWSGRSEAASKRGETLVKYEVGITQDEDFNVMRRLLVPGGGKIAKISRSTCAKLTVRGEGSGHLEGPENKEVSREPLMICISSAYPDSLAGARREVEELRVKLHEDYRAFCRERGLPAPDLKVTLGMIAS